MIPNEKFFVCNVVHGHVNCLFCVKMWQVVNCLHSLVAWVAASLSSAWSSSDETHTKICVLSDDIHVGHSVQSYSYLVLH